MVASTVSRFLKDKAYDYYATTIARNPARWSLKDVFMGLFDYCFPLNFRLLQKKKLKHLRQGDRSIREYMYELEDLLMMAGIFSEEDQVGYLWDGLTLDIQAELWRKKLNPIVSKWDEILEEALFIETSLEVIDHARKSRPGSFKQSNQPRNNQAEQAPRNRRDNQPRNQGRQHFQHRGTLREAQNMQHQMRNNIPRRDHQRREQGQRPRPHQNRTLIDKEKEDLRMEGKCFVCKEPGHMARNCPTHNRVRSNHPGRAPGVTINNVDVDYNEIELLRTLADSASVGNIELFELEFESSEDDESESNTSDNLPNFNWVGESMYKNGIRWTHDCSFVLGKRMFTGEGHEWPRDVIFPERKWKGERSTPIEDLYAVRATELLKQDNPLRYMKRYLPEEERKYSDFMVYQTTKNKYVIMNAELDEDLLISLEEMRNPSFQPAHWVCKQLDIPLLPPTPEDWETGLGWVPGYEMGDAFSLGAQYILNKGLPCAQTSPEGLGEVLRFTCMSSFESIVITDQHLQFELYVPKHLLENTKYDLVNAYAKEVHRCTKENPFDILDLEDELSDLFGVTKVLTGPNVELNAAEGRQVLQRNASVTKDFKHVIPEAVVVIVNIDGHPARALLDSGSLADFMSAKLAHQLKVKTFELEKLLSVQLAVQGSRTKVNMGCKTRLRYQEVTEDRYFDIINLQNYDLILGTPFLHQHKIVMGFNPTTIVVGSKKSLAITGQRVRTLASRATEVLEDRLVKVRQQLLEYAHPICLEAGDSPLPPLRSINHTISLKDEAKIYHWRPSKCSDALRSCWAEKRESYLKSGRWKMTHARNTSPMLLLTKPGTGVKGVPPRLRTVTDLRE